MRLSSSTNNSTISSIEFILVYSSLRVFMKNEFIIGRSTLCWGLLIIWYSSSGGKDKSSGSGNFGFGIDLQKLHSNKGK